jgi:hypothetical protein
MRLLVSTLLLIACLPSLPGTAQPAYFYPHAGAMDASIPTPEQFLGYPIGSQHTRHDQLLNYFRELDRLSDRVSLQVLGYTYEKRQQIAAIFTSPANQQRLESIRQAHLSGQQTGATTQVPLVIHLGYGVHGNEPSSSEAAMLTAYYLTASQTDETLRWLDSMVILMDPVINPDGRDRHSHWANMHKAEPPVADPQDREHNEIWPGGRFNHYWFDLNRDWFLGTFPETRNRIRFFHHWRPYVQTDHHEMGTNSTFYFDPGKEGSNNPIVPDYLYKNIYPRFGEYFAAAADAIGSMYYTKESFDKLYPGYGSSYANFYGGAGFLFEQGSSRGHVQETTTIPLTFAFTIRNQFIASLTTIRAALAEKQQLLTMRREFYKAAAAHAKSSPIKGYVFGDANDATKTNAFVNMLLMHQIEVYKASSNIMADGKIFNASSSYVVPCDQPNYLMVRTVFEKQISYSDSTFYDASTWCLPLAYGIPYAELKTIPALGSALRAVTVPSTPVAKSNYSYVFKITDYNAHKAIWHLQKGGALLQTAFRPFSMVIDGTLQQFGYGSISIPVHLQRIPTDSLYTLVQQAAQATGIRIHAVSSGYNAGGIDLGSNYLRTLKKPEAAMLVGTGVAATEAGEVWHLLDERIGMPISKLDLINFGRTSLDRYNVLVMVSGNYDLLDKAAADKIKAWVQNGGTLITLKTASEWAIRNGLSHEKLASDSSRSITARFNYDEAPEREGAKSLGGSIFRVDLDTTHPIGFGYTQRSIAVYRNNLTTLQPSANPYSTVAQYTADPLIAGYVHPSSLKKVRNTAAIVVSSEGKGRVILFSDNPNFRGTWYGTNKLFLNALFFGTLANTPAVNGE